MAWRLAAALLVAAAAAVASPSAGERSTPLLWRADASDRGSFFLLGSVHLGKRGDPAFGAAIDAAYQSAAELVVEVDLSRVPTEERASLAQRYSFLAPPRTLADVLGEATFDEVEAYLGSRGIPYDRVQSFKPWFLYFTIVQIELRRAGYDADLGVDRVFIDRATGSKPIVGLETIAGQLEVLDGLPAPLQELLLEDTLDDADGLAKEAEELVGAWWRGDEERLTELVFRPMKELPELGMFYERFFFERNRSMAERLLELGADGKTRFVVLGAGHMLGEQSVPALLASRGYRVRRVDDP
jgi:uncharacterized protein YbaP (TraB family)